MCTSGMRKHEKAAETQRCVCTRWFPCSCIPVLAEGKARRWQTLLSVQALAAELLIQVQNDV